MLPITNDGSRVELLSYDGDRPVTAWREHIHAGKAVGRLTVRTDGRLILPSGVIEARRSLKPWAKGRNLPWQPLAPFHFPFFSLMAAASEGGNAHSLLSLFRRRAVLFESGEREKFNIRPMRGRPGRPMQLPNSTLG